jgi:N-acetylmuramoyl-L-alanine amidase
LNGVDKKLIRGNSEENPVDTVNSEIYPDVTFKVQIAASTRKLETKSYNFKGLNEISRIKTDTVYKYFYGATSDYSKIKKQKDEAYKKGYNTSFIVAFKNGVAITLAEALKTTSN